MLFILAVFAGTVAHADVKDRVKEFKLVAIEGQTAYFDGLSIRRDGDKLYSAVRIGNGKGGSRVEQFSYSKKR